MKQEHLKKKISAYEPLNRNSTSPTNDHNDHTYSLPSPKKIDNTQLLSISDCIDSIAIPKNVGNSLFIETDHSYIPEFESLSMFAENVIQYIASYIARCVSLKSKCTHCIKLLLRIQKQRLIELKDKGGLFIPSTDLIKLCKYAEKMIKKLQNKLYT